MTTPLEIKSLADFEYDPDTHVNVYTPGTGQPLSVWEEIIPSLPQGETICLPIEFKRSTIRDRAEMLRSFGSRTLVSTSLGSWNHLLLANDLADLDQNNKQSFTELVSIDPYLGAEHSTPEALKWGYRVSSNPRILKMLAGQVSIKYGLPVEQVIEQMQFIANPPEDMALPTALSGIARCLGIRSTRDDRVSLTAFDFLSASSEHYTQIEVQAGHAELPEYPDAYSKALADYFSQSTN